MELDWLLTFGLLFLLVLVVIVVGAAVYSARLRRSGEALTPDRDMADPSVRPPGRPPLPRTSTSKAWVWRRTRR